MVANKKQLQALINKGYKAGINAEGFVVYERKDGLVVFPSTSNDPLEKILNQLRNHPDFETFLAGFMTIRGIQAGLNYMRKHGSPAQYQKVKAMADNMRKSLMQVVKGAKKNEIDRSKVQLGNKGRRTSRKVSRP